MVDIEIVPTNGGWMLRTGAIQNELFYKSSASAESAAVRLAQGLSTSGKDARVRIFIRDGSLPRQFLVPSLQTIAEAPTPQALAPVAAAIA